MRKILFIVVGLALITPVLGITGSAMAQTASSGAAAGVSASDVKSSRQQERAARKQARKAARANQKAQINAAKAQGQTVGPIGDDYPNNKRGTP